MAMAAIDRLHFVPSAVEGLSGVTEVVVRPDRLELLTRDSRTIIEFRDIARWHRRGWLYRPLARLSLGVWGRPVVADRDWFHPPAGRFFRFFTTPPITVHMPDELMGTDYGQSLFRQVQAILAAGGYGTIDLG